MTLNFTFLTQEQIFGKDALEVIKKYGTCAAPTDLAVLLGAFMPGSDPGRTSEGDITCEWGMATSETSRWGDVYFHAVDTDGKNNSIAWEHHRGCRPVLLPSETSKIHPNRIKKEKNGISVVTFGEYPQTVVQGPLLKELEDTMIAQKMKLTGKSYTFNARIDINDGGYSEQSHPHEYLEYEYKGKKYIRVQACPADNHSVLSNGMGIWNGASYWVEVEPVEWLADETGTWIAKKALFAGIPFRVDGWLKNGEYSSDFDKTFVKHYLDTCFAREILPSKPVAERLKGKDMLAIKSAKLEEVSDKERKVLKKKGLSGKALHDAVQKGKRLDKSRAMLKQKQKEKE